MKAARILLVCTAAFAVAFVGLVAAASAAEDKEVTLKGTIQCAKCALKKATVCTTCIVVKDGDKEVIYLFDDAGNKEPYHKEICTTTKKGSVKGVVTKKGDDLMIKPAKDSVKFD